ncbi:hypothetical protein [Actinomadura sediminis]|uniref:Uncharacterized protein n=1 Tax=Actinomadura sediminis TaxID=1038904 RepID=A0ABW3EMI3_9ACTN
MSGPRIGVTDWAIALGTAAILLVTGLAEPRSGAGPDLLGGALLVAGGVSLAA